MQVVELSVRKSTATTRGPSSFMMIKGAAVLKVGGYGFVPQRHRPLKKKEEQAKIDRAIAGGKKVPQPKRSVMDTIMNSRQGELQTVLAFPAVVHRTGAEGVRTELGNWAA